MRGDIIAPGETTAVIQEMHLVITHLLCHAIEKGIGK